MIEETLQQILTELREIKEILTPTVITDWENNEANYVSGWGRICDTEDPVDGLCQWVYYDTYKV